MKTNFFRSIYIIGILILSTLTNRCYADAATRTYILSKLKFYYIVNPNTDTTRTVIPMNSSSTDERNVFGGNAGMNPMKTFLKALLNDNQHGGDENFQFAFKEILRIRDKTIGVMMYNDAVPFNNFATTNFANCVDTLNYEWPCASSSSNKDKTIAGVIHIGQHFFSQVTPVNAKFVILHELVHTQDMSQFPQHSFYVNGRWYVYGFDGGHMYHEAIPSMGFAFMEGIANAFAYQFSGGQDYGPNINGWFVPTQIIAVEMNAPTTGGSNDIRLYQQLQAAGVTPVSTSGGYANYRINQLPPRILIHNEMVITSILYEYMNHISFSRVIRAFRTYNNGPSSVFSGNGNLQTMLTTLCQAGLPESMQAQSFPSCASFPERKEYLLPLAYADYFTSFSSTSANQFNELFDNGMNGDLITCYWQVRDAVKNSCKTVPNFSRAATEIAIALGINSSQAEDH